MGGIGYELARLFARDGWPLLLAARSGDKLTAFARDLTDAHHVPVAVCAVDLAAPDAPDRLFEAAQREGRPVGALVNNAGVGGYGRFAEADPAGVLQILQVNIVALTRLTRLFLPDMVRRNEGRIMNVASTAAFQAGPLMAVYYASKAYVLHFSEALDAELRKTKVRVTAFCPGPTATGFEAAAGLGASRLFTGRKVMSAAAAARVGYRGRCAAGASSCRGCGTSCSCCPCASSRGGGSRASRPVDAAAARASSTYRTYRSYEERTTP